MSVNPLPSAEQAAIQAKVDLANTLLDLAADDEISVTKITQATTTIRAFMTATANGGSSTNAQRDLVLRILVRSVYWFIRKKGLLG